MTVPEVVLEGCFPELSGFVLLDPRRLDEAVPNTNGQNLLELFGTSAVGDRVSAEGIAIPILNATTGYYTIVLRDRRSAARWVDPIVTSTGWVLGTATGTLLLCGAGYLTKWDPTHEAHRRVSIPPGWYRLDIDGYRLGPDSDDDYALDIKLSPATARPAFTADLTKDFSLDEPGRRTTAPPD